nr:3-oxoacyl-[acyl-carrier-protein] synthase ii, chloroplastic [Quercus suber]
MASCNRITLGRLAIQTGWVHPNVNLENPDEGVDKNVLVGPKTERLNIKAALSNSFGLLQPCCNAEGLLLVLMGWQHPGLQRLWVARTRTRTLELLLYNSLATFVFRMQASNISNVCNQVLEEIT